MSFPAESSSTFDISPYPSAPVLLFTETIDSVCGVMRCSNWRDYIPYGLADEGGPLSYSIGKFGPHYPNTLSYSDFGMYVNDCCLGQSNDFVGFSQQQQHQQQHQQNGTGNMITNRFWMNCSTFNEEHFDCSSMGNSLEADASSHETVLKTLYMYLFRTSSTALGDLTTPAALLTLLFIVFIFREVNSILLPYFSSVGRRLGRQTHGVEWERNNEERIKKFGEYVTRVIYHFCVGVYGIYFFYDQVWWDNNRGGTIHLFLNYPYHAIAPGMTWYYLIQAGYNLEAIVGLFETSISVEFPCLSSMASAITGKGRTTKTPATSEGSSTDGIFSSPILCIGWKDTIRGDFREMAIHHTVTNLLIFGSSYMRFTRVGSMVFLIHDISDVPVGFAKLANFLKWRKATTNCFITMCLTWLASRLIFLPFVIYRSVLYESILLVVDEWSALYFICYRFFFYALVGTLIALHAFWFGLFVKMGYTLAKKGEHHDLTYHKKGEKEEQRANVQKLKHANKAS